MDMKKILQAMDGVSTKPVEGASDMKKFVSIINEGANPHKVSLPVQMAMQHYQDKPVEKKKRPALIDKYFSQVEQEHLQEKQEKRQLINQYAKTIAERVLMKEGAGEGKWHTSPSGARTNMPPSDDDYEINYGANGAAAGENQPDAVTMDVPLLIRIMEYAREDAKTDMDLHNVAEQLISLSGEGKTLTMDDYDTVVGSETSVDEGKQYSSVSSSNSNINPELKGIHVPGEMRHPEWKEPTWNFMEIAEKLGISVKQLQQYAMTLGNFPNKVEGIRNKYGSRAYYRRSEVKRWVNSTGIRDIIAKSKQTVDEGKKIKPTKKSSPCWTGYKQVGMKKKDGKTVPNCTAKAPAKLNTGK